MRAVKKPITIFHSIHSPPLMVLRSIEGMTQKECADLLRIPLPILQQIESGEINCPANVHDRIEECFGIRFDSHLRIKSQIDP